MNIRVATEGDAEAIGAVLVASYSRLLMPDYDAEILARALPAMSAAQPRLLASGSYYIAEIDGRIAACGGWTREAPGSGEITEGTGHIRHFATHPDLTRRGAAGLLLSHCIAKARKAGVRTLSAMSTRTAVKFYQAHGFEVVAERHADFPDGVKFPSIEMRLEL